jgi:hypothetical protein
MLDELRLGDASATTAISQPHSWIEQRVDHVGVGRRERHHGERRVTA